MHATILTVIGDKIHYVLTSHLETKRIVLETDLVILYHDQVERTNIKFPLLSKLPYHTYMGTFILDRFKKYKSLCIDLQETRIYKSTEAVPSTSSSP
ncbi:hypothetical protein TNCV_4952021 [Trichonephila clavipes]|nr:hypothetical protein TNCV_4952021 [Trichonephila clavipes]